MLTLSPISSRRINSAFFFGFVNGFTHVNFSYHYVTQVHISLRHTLKQVALL